MRITGPSVYVNRSSFKEQGVLKEIGKIDKPPLRCLLRHHRNRLRHRRRRHNRRRIRPPPHRHHRPEMQKRYHYCDTVIPDITTIIDTPNYLPLQDL